MEAVGGYLQLELNDHGHFHDGGIYLNSGRSCLYLLIRARKPTKLYVPYYTCDVVIQPIERAGVAFEFYSLNEQLETPESLRLREDEYLLYTNYFGINRGAVDRVLERYPGQVILDNSQAFFERPAPGVDCFYSPRKFFGVPDGGVLFSDVRVPSPSEQDRSDGRMSHLLTRIESGAEAGFTQFRTNDAALSEQPPRRMSRLTDALLRNIDYAAKAAVRQRNFARYHDALGTYNRYFLPEQWSQSVPMFYPFLTDSASLRDTLIANKIFVARYWPNVMEWCGPTSLEYHWADRMIPLPVHDCVDQAQLHRIIQTVAARI